MTTADWKERIAPLLSSSMREVSDHITSSQPVQQWLHEASFEAAQGLADMQGMQAEAQGYMRMMDDLDDTFPNLVRAVEELTDGSAEIDLDWRPLTPNFSRLYLNFDWDADVSVFCRLEERTPTTAREVLDTIAESLPQSDPFPNRPHNTTGVVAHDGRTIAVRITAHRGDQESPTVRRYHLLPKDGSPLEDVDRDRAVQGLLQFFG